MDRYIGALSREVGQTQENADPITELLQQLSCESGYRNTCPFLAYEGSVTNYIRIVVTCAKIRTMAVDESKQP